jgi:rhodanese-related sulfurtransferase
MKKLLLIMIGALFMSACTTSSSYHKISAEEAKEMMAMQAVTIVDVRTLEEYNAGHIENAILIPNETISSAPSELDDKDAVILVYCRSGSRSKAASDKLVELGYTKVYDFGGIMDWPFEIVK